MKGRILAGVATLIAAVTASAQEYSEAEMALSKAAISIELFDELARRCANGAGFSAAQRKEVDAWQAANSVPQLRAHVQGALAPKLRAQVGDAAHQIIRQVAGGADPCVAAVSATRLPESQFAAKVPQLLAGRSPVPVAAATRESAPKPQHNSGNTAQLAALIHGFGFDTCTRMGIGGMLMVSACPVVLFRNGDALTDVEGLNHAQGLEAHKRAKPKSWTLWRRNGDSVQLKKEGWEKLGYSAIYSTLPKNFSLDGRFRSTGGAGTVGIGGGQSVAAWTDYVFFPDGRVERGGGAGASSTDGGTSVATASQAAGKAGRYQLDGITLVIHYDDGSDERRIIIADPKDDGKGTLWLDGAGYVRKER